MNLSKLYTVKTNKTNKLDNLWGEIRKNGNLDITKTNSYFFLLLPRASLDYPCL